MVGTAALTTWLSYGPTSNAAPGTGAIAHVPAVPATVDDAPDSHRSDTSQLAADDSETATTRQPVPDAGQLRGRLLQRGEPIRDHVVELWSGPYQRQRPSGITSRTDADGKFALPFAAGTVAWLHASGPRVSAEWRHGVWQQECGDIAVPAPGILRGRVVDDAGNGLAAVEVLSVCTDAVGRPSLFERSPEDVDGPRSTTTAADGSFVFERAHPGNNQIGAHRAGLLAATTSCELDQGGEVTIELVLRRGRRVSGFVYDHRGDPVAGAQVYGYGGFAERATTDQNGAFTCPALGRRDRLHVRAGEHGGIDGVDPGPDGGPAIRIQLPAVATVRVRVVGHRGADCCLKLAQAFGPDGRTPAHQVPMWMHERCSKPIAMDGTGTLELRGAALADYSLEVLAEGVGRSLPRLLSLQGDQEVELEIVPDRTCVVRVVDEAGSPLAGIRVSTPVDATEYTTRLEREGVESVLAWMRGPSSDEHEQRTAADGTVTVQYWPHAVLALLVDGTGYRSTGRAFPIGAAPASVEVRLESVALLRGRVVARNPGAHELWVGMWPSADEAAVRAGSVRTLHVPVDAAGNFRIGLLPGEWRMAVGREGIVQTGRPEQHGGPGVPLLDNGLDLRSITSAQIHVGEVAEVELTEPALGMLTGRVLFAGEPQADVRVVGRRVAEAAVWDLEDPQWTDRASGSFTGKDGRFAFAYRDKGPCELLVKHVRGTATIVTAVSLPPPGEPVDFDVTLPGGSVRGRFRVDLLPAELRSGVRVHLFPWSTASADPFASTYNSGWSPPPLVVHRKGFDLGVDDDSFLFEFVPPGKWLLRIHVPREGPTHATLCDRIVTVHDRVAELGELVAAATVNARFTIMPGGAGLPGAVEIHRTEGDTSVWIATVRVDRRRDPPRGVIDLHGLPPGSYVVKPPQHLFVGQPTVDPFTIELGRDGTVVTDPAGLQPSPSSQRR